MEWAQLASGRPPIVPAYVGCGEVWCIVQTENGPEGVLLNMQQVQQLAHMLTETVIDGMEDGYFEES